MSATFNLLTAGGARFDKARFTQDINLFSTKDRKGKTKVNDSLPSSLNFFHDHHPPSSKTGRPNSTQTVPPDAASDFDPNTEEDADHTSSHLQAPPLQKITISGSDPLPHSLETRLTSLTTHSKSSIPSQAGRFLLRSLGNSNIQSLWGVQTAVGGAMLEDRDVLCIAPTGSGKTLAYVLPLLVKLVDPARYLRDQGDNTEAQGIRSVVLVPTHDLAVQIHGVVKAVTQGRAWRCMVLTKATEKAVCESSPGRWKHEDTVETDEESEDEKMSEGDEDGSVEDEDEAAAGSSAKNPLAVDVLIATPERLNHLVENGRLSMAKTRHLILDESDRLLSTDFLPQVEPIVHACTLPAVQKCLLTATMPSGAEELARRWLRDGGVRVVVGIKDSAVTTVDQSLLFTSTEQGKMLALRNLVAEGNLPYPSLIFVQSVERADELFKSLVLNDLRVEMVHGGRSIAKRDEAIRKFREGSVWVLVVTEVLARGMDFRGVKVVINYDFPQTVQSYIHRIGRTGRAGRPGKAITFLNTEDAPYLRTIANVLRSSGCPVPQYMLDLPKPSKNLKRQLAKAPVKRKTVGGGGRDVASEQRRKKSEMVKASKRRKEGKVEHGKINTSLGGTA